MTLTTKVGSFGALTLTDSSGAALTVGPSPGITQANPVYYALVDANGYVLDSNGAATTTQVSNWEFNALTDTNGTLTAGGSVTKIGQPIFGCLVDNNGNVYNIGITSANTKVVPNRYTALVDGNGDIVVYSGGGPSIDPTIGVPVLTLAVPANTYPPQLNTPLPVDWQAGVTSVRLQAATVANADAGWTTTLVDDLHLISDAEAIAGAWTVTGISGITTPAVTVFRARAENGASIGAWSNELIHGDVTAPSMTSSTSPTAIPELASSTVYTATFNEKVTITGFGGTDAALLEAVNPTVPSTTFTIRRLDNTILDYENKTSYSFTINFKDRANNTATSSTITAAVSDIDEIPTLSTGFFTDKTSATASTVYSPPESYTVAGLATSLVVPITVTGGEYRKNGGTWTSSADTTTNGDVIEVRGTSSAVDGGVVNVVLTIGGGSDTYSIFNVNSFDPASLFGPSDEGYFFDISDLNTVFSDTARTTLATVNGPVKGVTDKSGKGHHLAWVSGNTLTLRQSGSFYYLEASATNGVTLNTVSLTQPWYRISALRIDNWAAFKRVLGSGTASHGQVRQNGSSPAIFLNDGSDGPQVSPTLSTDYVISEVHNNTSSSIQLNSASAVTATTGTQTGDGQTLFNAVAGTSACAGRFYGNFAINRDPTSGEKASLKTFFAAKYGGTL